MFFHAAFFKARVYYWLFLTISIPLIHACSKKEAQTSMRSFYMGVTPWPPDFTVDDVDRAYNFINNNCDIVSHHFDEGIPYEEAANNLPMPLKLQNDISTRITKTKVGQPVFLSVSAVSLSRTGKAGWLTDNNDPVKENYWLNKSFDDSLVIKAYVNYISYLVNTFQPSFVNYGVESNSQNWEPAKFLEYRNFLSAVYTQLKSKYPSLPLFISFMVAEDNGLLNNAAALTGFTDYIALSAYPYTNVSTSVDGNTDPALFPPDYFTRFINLSPGKPFGGFAETGYIAENLDVTSFNLHKTGTAKWQADYLEKVCLLSNDYHAKFFIWFCGYDYDAADKRLKDMGLYIDLFALWEDTGLYDEDFNPRRSYNTWNTWMGRERK